MKVNFVSAKSAVKEFLRNSGHAGELDRTDILAWANDAVSLFITDEQLLHKIILLDVKNYKAELPKDFKSIIQAGYKLEEAKSCTQLKTEIVQFKQKQWGCDLEITVKCPKCHKVECSCNEPSYVVDIDRMWANAHPEHMMAYAKHFYSYGKTYSDSCCYHDDYRLMRPNSASFHNLEYHIGNCINLNLDCEVNYIVDLPNIVVNFKEGKILLAYLARHSDEDGYLMIPDTARAHEAVYRYVQEKMLYKKYLEDFSQNVRIAWQTSVELKERAISRARAELQMPEFDEFQSFVSKFIHKVLPYYKAENNLYRTSNKNFNIPNQTYN